jgi:hypothetical protein
VFQHPQNQQCGTQSSTYEQKLDKIFAKFGLEKLYYDGQITTKPMGKQASNWEEIRI